MRRGEIWWASLLEPLGSMPGYRRPVIIVQADSFNASLIKTVVVVPLTTNLRLVSAPGNFLLTATESGLTRDSVVNVSQLITVDKSLLTEPVGQLQPRSIKRLEDGLRLVLAL
jgi:mRNA interferase MazF